MYGQRDTIRCDIEVVYHGIRRLMRWFLALTLLALFALAACSSQPTPPTAAPANTQTVTVYKSPT
jgi:hypothetical protein